MALFIKLLPLIEAVLALILKVWVTTHQKAGSPAASIKAAKGVADASLRVVNRAVAARPDLPLNAIPQVFRGDSPPGAMPLDVKAKVAPVSDETSVRLAQGETAAIETRETTIIKSDDFKRIESGN